MDNPPTPPTPNNRLEARSNMFVMAALYTGSGSTPVRIRNMSRSGALVEAAVLPPPGKQVRLSRGSLSVTGEVVWVDKQKAGVRFDSMTSPDDWLPGGKRSADQQMADEVAHQTRLGAGSTIAAALTPAHSPQLSEELMRLHEVLMRAAEDLASNNGLSASQLIALQEIDVTAQRLANLAGEIDAGNRARWRPAL
jgi:hypothetical protein